MNKTSHNEDDFYRPKLSKRVTTLDSALADARLQALQTAQPSKSVQAVLVGAMFISMLLVALDMGFGKDKLTLVVENIIATAIPVITSEFHRTDQVGWYGSSFFLALATTVSFWDKAYKYVDRKWTFLTALLVFELGCLLCALAPGSHILVLDRAIQGSGGAGVLTGVYTIIPRIVESEQVPFVLWLTGAVFSISSVLGPVVGGILTQQLSWRWCFYVNIPIGGFAMLLVSAFLRKPPQVKSKKKSNKSTVSRFDFWGVTWLLGSLTCLFLVLEWGGISKPWSDKTLIGTLIGFVLMLLIFAVVEALQKEKAMIVPRIIKTRTMSTCCVFIFCTNCAGFAHSYNLPIYFQAVSGVTPFESGIRLLPSVLSVALFTIISSRLVSRVGWIQPFFILGAALGTVGGGLIYTFSYSTSTGQLIGYQIVAGAGLGLCTQIPLIVAQQTSDKRDLATATATVLFFQFLGAAVGISCSQSILNSQMVAELARTSKQLNPLAILNAGAYDLSKLYPDQATLATVIGAFSQGLKSAWIYSIIMSGIAFVVAFLPEWRNIFNATTIEIIDGEEIED